MIEFNLNKHIKDIEKQIGKSIYVPDLFTIDKTIAGNSVILCFDPGIEIQVFSRKHITVKSVIVTKEKIIIDIKNVWKVFEDWIIPDIVTPKVVYEFLHDNMIVLGNTQINFNVNEITINNKNQNWTITVHR